MTDDIVTRLREVCMCKGITCPHDGVDLEAADEIERLRELADTLVNKVRHSATCSFMWKDDDPCSCGVFEVRKEYWSVRGK